MSDEQKTYACPECGFHYRDEETAKNCEAWCNEHGACSAEITKHSVERESAVSDTAVSDTKEADTDFAAKCAELENNWKRALADYQNLQKDVARQREEMGAYAVLRVVERFLPVVDNFNTAISHQPSAVSDPVFKNWIIGIGFIQKQLDEVMKDLGLTPIKTVGEKFDAAKHEAVGEEEPSAVSSQPSGTIIREVQAGYEVLGKVVRPAKVITTK